MSDSIESTSPRSSTPLVLVIAGLAFTVAALALVGFGASSVRTMEGLSWQAWLLTALALPLVLGGGAAFGPLLLMTPVAEPSPLKLGLFSSALSPVLVAAGWYGLAIGLELPVQQAWAGTFALVGGLALLGARRQLSAAPAGRAAGLVCVFALVLAGLAAAAVWSETGLGARLSSNATIAQTALAQTLQDGAPSGNPWVAGLPLELRPGIAALLVAAAGPGQLLPLYCLGFVIAWCLGLLAIASYLASAALFRETGDARAGLRDATAAAAVVLVAIALDGGRASVHRWLSMAYTMTFLVAALHAVRRGARPWPGLSACLLGVLGLLHPWAALGGGLTLIAMGLVAGRRWLPPFAGLALLPGFLVGRLFGGFSLEQALPYVAARSSADGVAAQLSQLASRFLGERGGLFAVSPGMWIATLLPLCLGAAALLWLMLRGAPLRADPRDRSAARLGAGLVAALILAWVCSVALLPRDAGGDRADLLGAALLVASLGVGRALQCLPLGRAAFLGAAALLVGVGLPAKRTLTQLSPPKVPFKEHADHLALGLEPPLQEGLIEAYEFIRLSSYAADPRTILFREPGAIGPVRREEALSVAPILTGVALFGGRALSPGTNQSRALAPGRRELRTELGDTPFERRELLNVLFEYESKWQHRYSRVLDALRADGHTLLFLVTEGDRRSTTDRGSGPRGVDNVLLRMGAAEVFQGLEVSVYAALPTASQ